MTEPAPHRPFRPERMVMGLDVLAALYRMDGKLECAELCEQALREGCTIAYFQNGEVTIE